MGGLEPDYCDLIVDRLRIYTCMIKHHNVLSQQFYLTVPVLRTLLHTSTLYSVTAKVCWHPYLLLVAMVIRIATESRFLFGTAAISPTVK